MVASMEEGTPGVKMQSKLFRDPLCGKPCERQVRKSDTVIVLFFPRHLGLGLGLDSLHPRAPPPAPVSVFSAGPSDRP